MPELPEVETIARGLAKRVTGDVIESVWLGQKKEPLKSPAAEIAATLEHAASPQSAAWANTSSSTSNRIMWGGHSCRQLREAARKAKAKAADRTATDIPPQRRKQRRTGVSAHTNQSPMDRSPRHDRTPASLRAATPKSRNTRTPSSNSPRAGNCASSTPAASAASASPAGRLRCHRRRAARSRPRPLHRAIPRPQNSHQKRSAQPEPAARRRQHLRR